MYYCRAGSEGSIVEGAVAAFSCFMPTSPPPPMQPSAKHMRVKPLYKEK